MRGTTTLLAFAALTATGAPAYAGEPPAADLRLDYGQPVVAAGNTGISWRWTLTNRGAAVANAVVVTHRVSPGQTIVAVSAPCTSEGPVVCRFEAIKPGESHTGWITTSIPAGAKDLKVNARLTWR